MSLAPLAKRITTIVVVLLCILYFGESISVRYRIPASRDPLGTVQISKLYAVPQKGGKTEYEPGESETQTCVHSIFPHLGYSPCWYLNRHRNQEIDY